MSNVEEITYEGVPIKLDKVRHLKYALKSIRLIVQKYGSIQKAFEILQKCKDEIDDAALEAIAVLAHAGLVHEDRDLTQEDVENLIEFKHINQLADKMVEAMSDSLPSIEEGKPNSQSTE